MPKNICYLYEYWIATIYNLTFPLGLSTHNKSRLNFMILTPSSPNMTSLWEWEFSQNDLDVQTYTYVLCDIINCYDCPHYSGQTQARLGKLNSNILIKACLVFSSILSRLHIWIGEDSWALNLLSRIFLSRNERKGGGGEGINYISSESKHWHQVLEI